MEGLPKLDIVHNSTTVVWLLQTKGKHSLTVGREKIHIETCSLFPLID